MNLLDLFLREDDKKDPPPEQQVEEEEEKSKYKDLAMMIDPGRHSTDFILYKPYYYSQRIKKDVDDAKNYFHSIRFKKDRNKFKDFYSFSNVIEIFQDTGGIYGYMSINSGNILGLNGTCNRANELRAISSREGYETLMFWIALIKENPIMPHREKTSVNAYDQWKTFYNDPTVDKEKFTDEMGVHKKDVSDCSVYHDPIADASYSIKIEKDVQIQPLTNRHLMFVNQLQNYFKKNEVDFIKSRIKEYIADAGVLFFLQKKGDQGWYENKDFD